MLRNGIVILVFLLGFAFSQVDAQTTIWSVNFETGYSDNDETAQDNNDPPTGADWTKTGTPSNWWRVESANAISGSLSMSGRNTDGVMTWTSESISLSGFTNIGVSILIGETNYDNDGDYVRTYYNIGSGNVEFGVGNGEGNFGGTATNSVSGLSASSITIVVEVNNDDGGDRGLFDNIVVTGTPGLGKDGPGGVGATDGAGDLELWLVAEGNTYTDAGSTSATDGQDIEQWNDQSGNTHHATETTASEQPSLNTNAVNGFSTVVFDDTDERILSTGLTTNDEATVFTVFQLNGFGSGANDGIVHAATSGNAFSGTGSTKTIGMWVATSDGDIWGRGVESGGTQRNISQVTSLSTGQFYAITQDYDGSDITQYVNGATAGTVSYDGTLQSWTDFGIGRQGTETMDGEIAEMIAFKSSANLAQRIIVQNYLAAKYGLSLSSNDLYNEDNGGNGNFDYEVAGIGQASDGTNHQDAQGTGAVRINTPNGLANSEFLIWGHDNGSFSLTSTDVPSGVGQLLTRKWRASETGEVGTITISFDLSNLSGSYDAADLRLIIDSDNDGSFSDESGASVISGASNTSGSIFEWTGVDIDDSERFTIGLTTLGYLGPGGVGSTDGTGNLVLWLDANTITGLADGAAVSSWSDQSGYGNDAGSSAIYTCENDPEYEAAASGQNGVPSVYFDGDNFEILEIQNSSSMEPTQDVSIFGVYQPAADAGNDNQWGAILMHEDDDSWQDGYCFGCRDASSDDYTFYAGNDFDEGIDPYGGDSYDANLANGTHYALALRRVYSTGTQSLYINNVIASSTDSDGANDETINYNASDEILIGGYTINPCNDDYVLEGYIPEIFMYNTLLNDAQFIIVYNYLTAKYGLSLGSSDFYNEDDSGFDYDVAGIGQAADGSNHLDAQGTGIVRVNSASGLGDGEYFIWGHDNDPLSSFGETDLPTGIESRLAREWAVSETGEVGTVTISFDLSAVFGSITASDLRLLIDDDANGFSDESGGNVLSGATNVSGDIYAWTGVDLNDNDRFTVGSIDVSNTPLPIVLESFEAKHLNNQEVLLEWVTTAEINNDYFTLEKSIDGKNWEAFATIYGAGNSNVRIPYDFVDNNPYEGFSLYRLKQTDFDGQYSYSQNERINIAKQKVSEFKIYPNPGSYQITIEGDPEEMRNVQFFNLSGQEISPQLELLSNESGRLIYNISNLKNGTYLIRAGKYYKRFVKF